MMDDLNTALRLSRLEAEITEMRDKEIANTLYSFSAAKPDEVQRVFSDGGGGTVAVPKSFDIRIRWQVEQQADGTEISVPYLDIYSPYVEYETFASSEITSNERHVAVFSTPHTFVGDGWYQFAKLADWPKDTPFYIDLDMSALGANVAYDENAGYKLIFIDRDDTVVLGGGDKPENLYPNSKFVVRLALIVDANQLHQLVNGPCTIRYVSANDHALYAQIGSGSSATLTDDFTGVSFNKDSQLYFCTRLMAEITFFDNSTIHAALGKPPISQADTVTPIFYSKIPCRLHATDHYDNFIPAE